MKSNGVCSRITIGESRDELLGKFVADKDCAAQKGRGRVDGREMSLSAV